MQAAPRPSLRHPPLAPAAAALPWSGPRPAAPVPLPSPGPLSAAPAGGGAHMHMQGQHLLRRVDAAPHAHRAPAIHYISLGDHLFRQRQSSGPHAGCQLVPLHQDVHRGQIRGIQPQAAGPSAGVWVWVCTCSPSDRLCACSACRRAASTWRCASETAAACSSCSRSRACWADTAAADDASARCSAARRSSTDNCSAALLACMHTRHAHRSVQGGEVDGWCDAQAATLGAEKQHQRTQNQHAPTTAVPELVSCT